MTQPWSIILLQVIFSFQTTHVRSLSAVERTRTRTTLSYEVNCAPGLFAWKLQIYDDTHADASSIRAGKALLLYHQELKLFVAAESESRGPVYMV